MELFDTHCHIHESQVSVDDNDATRKLWAKLGNPSVDVLVANARAQNVTHMMCVGCTLADSRRAIEVVAERENMWASIGIHPHEAQAHLGQVGALEQFAQLATAKKVKAIGECGLDYFYEHSPKEAQVKVLRFQLELAQKQGLPLIFHVRDAFDDFWPIFDEYPGLTGVIHSFTATEKELAEVLKRGLYVGLNGIMTFTKSAAQLAAAKAVPLDKLVLETDAPFLTPEPYRGTICEPKYVRVTAEFLAKLRSEPLATLADATTHNAHVLFDL
ncbi:MAG: TatD family hydrolase [Candidatus Saccharibacteria bacterium]